ncbi:MULTISPECIES: AAA family ATPase [Spirulina sp. CCY15215]|uniref:AAA family ATPase n=1 Tax=Spirulina sp. CCY15215 TaxID=2767591 RepID=UPI00194F5F5F|nr:AAA family ATPase [Spirulina major]
MIFKRLIIQNFRQFQGEQEIVFSTENNKNVTVIHGFNGSGKTTLLNTFTWLFYATFSPDFENQELLETEATFAQLNINKELVTSAKLYFEDRDKTYMAERKQIVTKTLDGKRKVLQSPTLTVHFHKLNGEWEESRNPQDLLEQLLPKPLSPFFFFNGERIEKLASSDAYKDIEAGVKILLDIEVYDRAIKHLNGEIIRTLRREIGKRSGKKGEQVENEIEQLEEQQDNINKKIQQSKARLQKIEEEKKRIDEILLENPELRLLQEQRQNQEKARENKKKESVETEQQLAQEVSQHGYLILVSNVLQKAEEILDTAYQKGELPIDMKRPFVRDLLEKQQCICGRELAPGTESYSCVEKWHDRVGVGSEELEKAVIRAKGSLPSLRERRTRALEKIGILQEKRGEIEEEIIKIGDDLSEISKKIGGRELSEDYDYGKLEKQRKKAEEAISELNLEIGRDSQKSKSIGGDIQQKERELNTIAKSDLQGQLAQCRLDTVNNVREAIEKIRYLRQKELVEDISERLNRIWNKISIKDYKAQFTDEYRLNLVKKIGTLEQQVSGTSTGEKQILSLVFIGSLVDKARSIYREKNKSQKNINQKHLFRGGLYPLVIDSAFGQLELDYRRDVAHLLPTLAPQIIIFVSESQWRGEAEKSLISNVGSQWILECSTPKERGKKITLNGKEYSYIVESKDEFECTQLVEVEV